MIYERCIAHKGEDAAAFDALQAVLTNTTIPFFFKCTLLSNNCTGQLGNSEIKLFTHWNRCSLAWTDLTKSNNYCAEDYIKRSNSEEKLK